MNLFWQGLTISLLGLGLTFAALGLFILAMVLLKRLFPEAPKAEEQPVTSALSQASDEDEIAAAIAAALSHLQSLEICRSGLGEALEAGRGRWWLVSRATAYSAKAHRANERDNS